MARIGRVAPVTSAPERQRVSTIAAVLLLVLAPLTLLAPSVFGDHVFVPFDLAQFPPKSLVLDADQRQAIAAHSANPDVSEIPVLVLPELELARSEALAGRFPAWNPYARFGSALFAHGLNGLAYPPNTALLAFDEPAHGLAAKAWFAMAMGGVLAFAFLRALGLLVLPALFGAVAFSLGGTATANLHFYMRYDVLAWLPGVLLGCLGVVRADRAARRALAAAGLAVATACVFLAGFPPYAIAALMAAGMFALAMMVAGLRRRGLRTTVVIAATLLGAIAAGVGLAAVQLLPSFAFFPESNRALSPSFDDVRRDAFEWYGLLGFLMPTAFGVPGGQPAYPYSPLVLLLANLRTEAGQLFAPPNYNYTEYAVFAGTVPLVLTALALMRRCARTWGLLLLAAVLFTLAHAPSFLAPVYGVPVLASVSPMRFVGLLALLVAALAALGLHGLLGERPRRAAIVAGVLALVVALVAAMAASSSPLGDAGSVISQLVERYRPQIPGLDDNGVRTWLGGGNPAASDAVLIAARDRLDANLWRAAVAFGLAGVWSIAIGVLPSRRARVLLAVVACAATAAELVALAQPWTTGRPLPHDPVDTPVHEVLHERNAERAGRGGILVARAAPTFRVPLELPAGTLVPERVRDFNAYTFVDGRSWRPLAALWGEDLMIRRYWPKALPDDDRLRHPLLDLLGIDTLLSTGPLANAGSPLVEPLRDAAGGTFHVYGRPTALPRAFVVHALRELPDDEAVIAAMIDPALDPRAALLVTADAADSLASAPAQPRPATPRPVRFVSALPDEIVIEVGDGPAGYLVLADAALSGWSARVGGVAVPIARGNLFMRSVPVAAGVQRVTFTYSPPGLFVGLTVSVLTLIGLLFVGWRSVRSLRGWGTEAAAMPPLTEQGPLDEPPAAD